MAKDLNRRQNVIRTPREIKLYAKNEGVLHYRLETTPSLVLQSCPSASLTPRFLVSQDFGLHSPVKGSQRRKSLSYGQPRVIALQNTSDILMKGPTNSTSEISIIQEVANDYSSYRPT